MDTRSLLVSTTQALIDRLTAFDIFHGFSSDELQKIIQFCHPVSYDEHASIYTTGEESQDLEIFLRVRS